MTPEPVDRLGRADLHIHTWASDGTSSVVGGPRPRRGGRAPRRHRDRRPRADRRGARRPADRRRTAASRVEVVVGEEITTRGGHLLGLFLERPVPAAARACAGRSRRSTTRAASRSRPTRWCRIPMCAQGFALRTLLASDDPAGPPRRRSRRSTRRRSAATATGTSSASRRSSASPELGNSDAHAVTAVGTAWTTFPGRTPDDVRAAPRGAGHAPPRQPSTAPSDSWACSAASCASTGGTLAGGDRRPGPARRHRPRPRLPRRPLSARRGSTRGGFAP